MSLPTSTASLTTYDPNGNILSAVPITYQLVDTNSTNGSYSTNPVVVYSSGTFNPNWSAQLIQGALYLMWRGTGPKVPVLVPLTSTFTISNEVLGFDATGINPSSAPLSPLVTLTPSGVTAAQVIAGSPGDEVAINAAIALLGRAGGGTLNLQGTFYIGNQVINLENNVNLITTTSATITMAYDFTASSSTFDWAIVMGRTGGVALENPSINASGQLTVQCLENGMIGPNDQVYLCCVPGGALPAGVSANQKYYLVNYLLGRNTFVTTQLSLTQGGAPITATNTGTGSLFLFYTWFQSANVNTGTGYITFPSPGQRLPINWPCVFRASSNVNTDLPTGLLGRPNVFYPMNEVPNGNGTYSYQFSQTIGGAAVSISDTGSASDTFSCIPCTKSQLFSGISVNGSAQASASSATIGLIQIQTSSIGCDIVGCPSIAGNRGYSINARAIMSRVIGCGIVNTHGGILAAAATLSLVAQNNVFSGAAGAADINIPTPSTGAGYNLCINNKLTGGGITNGDANSIVSPNF
jgi:hypothetical protein